MLTGSCVDALTGIPVCAVDADSCDAGDAWTDARRTRDVHGLDCTLCDPADLVWPTPAPTAASFQRSHDSAVADRVESKPYFEIRFNVSVPERILQGLSLSSRRELGERIRTVQESLETSSI